MEENVSKVSIFEKKNERGSLSVWFSAVLWILMGGGLILECMLYIYYQDTKRYFGEHAPSFPTLPFIGLIAVCIILYFLLPHALEVMFQVKSKKTRRYITIVMVTVVPILIFLFFGFLFFLFHATWYTLFWIVMIPSILALLL